MLVVQFLSSLVSMFLLGGSIMTSQNFVVGEVLFKFAGGTEGGAAVEKSLQTSPPDLSAISQVLNALQAEVEIPVKPVRLASGGWILVTIDAHQVARRAAEKLRSCDEVASVALVDMKSRPDLREAASNALLVEFARQPASPESRGPRMQDSEISAKLGLPIVVSHREKNQVLIEIDWKELTLILVERLKAIRDVEAAQPNFVLGIRSTS